MRNLALAVASLALLAGCSDAREEELVSAKRLPTLVLQPSDLPTSFVRFDHGRIGFTDIQGGPRGDERRFGREGGWKARYKRAGSAETRGPLVVVSFADVFRSTDGARKDLDAYEREFRDGRWSAVEAATVGDASAAVTLRQGSGSAGLRYYAIVWRERNVTASLEVSGFEGKISLEDALELARRQERRIEQAG